jgi:hypothetical protein
VRTRQGKLLRKYAVVFGALVGGALIARSLVPLYFSYQESQAALLSIERAEAGRAAGLISQFVESMHAQVAAIIPPPGLGEPPLDDRRTSFLALQRRVARTA